MTGRNEDWQPSCTTDALRARAAMLASIRRFFAERGVLEVETPLLCHGTGTDPNLQPFVTGFRLPGQAIDTQLYLQTSPEFAMKRLLAAGSGSIFQICKAFRNGESGRFHNPEFTMLEWYRVGFGLDDLMDEIEALLGVLLEGKRTPHSAVRVPYRKVFEDILGPDPIRSDLEQLAKCAQRRGFSEAKELCESDRNLWLDFLFSHIVQPAFERDRIYFVYDYPACLPSLARRKNGDDEVVERVEVFLDGMELGNGFHELADAREQEERFEAELAVRQEMGLPLPSKDYRLLSALASGLPDCCGVAIGLERLLMLMTGAESIEQVLAFSLNRA